MTENKAAGGKVLRDAAARRKERGSEGARERGSEGVREGGRALVASETMTSAGGPVGGEVGEEVEGVGGRRRRGRADRRSERPRCVPKTITCCIRLRWWHEPKNTPPAPPTAALPRWRTASSAGDSAFPGAVTPSWHFSAAARQPVSDERPEGK
jgi:hypothetical protein